MGALRLGPAFAEAPKISFDHSVMENTDAGAGARGGLRVVGHRRLEGGMGAEPARRGRRGARGQHLRPGRARQLPALGRPAALRARARRCRRRRDRRRGARRADRPRAGDQGAGRRARGARRRRGMGAGAGAAAVGMVPDRRPRAAVPGQADRGSAWPEAVAAEAPPSRRALGRGRRHRRGHARRRGLAGARERVDLPAARLHAPAGEPRAHSRSRSSRCRPAPTSRRTTSCGSRTISGAPEADGGEVRDERRARPRRRHDRPGLRGLGDGLPAAPAGRGRAAVGGARRPRPAAELAAASLPPARRRSPRRG